MTALRPVYQYANDDPVVANCDPAKSLSSTWSSTPAPSLMPLNTAGASTEHAHHEHNVVERMRPRRDPEAAKQKQDVQHQAENEAKKK